MPHFFYLARCSDESLYAGTCINLEARERKHNDGTGAKYTRSRRPVRIEHSSGSRYSPWIGARATRRGWPDEPGGDPLVPLASKDGF